MAAAKKWFRANETFHHASSDLAIHKGDLLPADNPVVEACPEYFTSVDESGAGQSARWETAAASHDVAPKQAPKRSPRRSEE